MRTQPTQAQMQPVADEVGEADSQRVRRVKIGVAVGADDRQPPQAGVASHELKQPDRALVGPVQVVHDQQQRSGT